MKNPIFTSLLFGIFILSGCSQIENSNISELKQNSEKNIVFSSQEEVVTFLKSVDNSNPIFLTKNLLSNDNKKFKVKNEFYNEVKIFLQKINLESLYELESIAGDKKLTKNDCNIIIREAKKRIDDVDPEQCDWSLKQDNTYEYGDPLFVFLYQLEENYLYLNVIQEGLEGINYLNILYDIKTQEIIDLTKNTKTGDSMYFYDNKIWFLQFNTIKSSYDLKTKEFSDLSTNSHNKSYKWWITQLDPNFIVKSFDNTKTINLGNLNRDGKNKNMDYIKFGTYFETNESNSYFASLDNVSCKEYDCIATIRYGELKENGLKDSKTYEVKYQPFETMCWESANSALLLKDNFIITRGGCPSILELAVFDIEEEKIIYRNNTVDSNL